MPGDSASSAKRRRSSGSTKKIVIRRFPQSINNVVHRFKRNVAMSTTTGAGAAILAGNWLALGSLNNSTEFTTLFEQYKLTHMKVRFMLTQDPAGPSPSTGFVPRIWYVSDKNNATAPASINELREQSGVRCRMLNPYRPVVLNFKPYVQSEVNGGNAVSPKRSPWLSTSGSSIAHNGWKFAIDTLPTGYKLEQEVTVYLSCRNIH